MPTPVPDSSCDAITGNIERCHGNGAQGFGRNRRMPLTVNLCTDIKFTRGTVRNKLSQTEG